MAALRSSSLPYTIPLVLSWFLAISPPGPRKSRPEKQVADRRVDDTEDVGPRREHDQHVEERSYSEGRRRVDLAKIHAVEQRVHEFHGRTRERIPEHRAQQVAHHDRYRKHCAELPGIERVHCGLRRASDVGVAPAPEADDSKYSTASSTIRWVHHRA